MLGYAPRPTRSDHAAVTTAAEAIIARRSWCVIEVGARRRRGLLPDSGATLMLCHVA